MSHWAEIDDKGFVVRVVVGNNDDANEGLDWLNANLGGTWIQTSYNTRGGKHSNGGTPLRKNFASAGYFYDAKRDAFTEPQPFPSWILDEESCLWQSPIPFPEDGKDYRWSEESQSWQLVTSL